MRPIKFRQAIKAHGKLPFRWHYWGYIEEWPHDFILPIGKVEWDDRRSFQFTGLLDKNGKEIYEGDIVKYDQYGIGWVIHTIDHKEKHQFAGENFLSAFGWTDGITMSCFCNYNRPYQFAEVVGNVYENPELLEEKK